MTVSLSYISSQTVVKLALPDNCNKAITSTENLHQSSTFKIDVRPNPNNGNFELYVRTEKPINKVSIDILDFSGKMVYRKSIFCNSTSFIKHFEIPGLTSGIYVLFFKSEATEASTKIIIK